MQRRFPKSYENRPVREALGALTANPCEETLAQLLEAASRGGLVVDLTGSPEETPRARMLQSTDGRSVLPLFTSLAELGATVREAGGSGKEIRAVVLPGAEALALALAEDVAAVQFDPRGDGSGTPGVVVAREHLMRLTPRRPLAPNADPPH